MPRGDRSTDMFLDASRRRPDILAEGRNCWRQVRATRASLLTNADYFRRLAVALAEARHRILLIGWDLDAALVLDPSGAGPEARPLVDFLMALMAARPSLEIRFLLWDRTIFYGGNRRCAGALAALTAAHRNFCHHFAPAPLGCSHHAKLVVVDDALAFVGGIDLAGDRWDRVDHPPSHPERVTPAGEAYGPVHDLQMIVTGPAAGVLAQHACERWARETGETLPSLGTAIDAWPPDLPADFTDVPAAVARTDPGLVREVERLNLDALAAARHCIYLEAQYLTAEIVGGELVRRLEAWDGPEMVVVVTRTSHGHLEQFAMGNNRDRLLRRLKAADRWNRLRVYYPTATDGSARVDVKIHAKLVVIDDRLLRVGSSNLNNRSMAVDTECDLALEAVTPAHRAAIRMIRNRLIAELVHRPVAAVAEAFRRHGSLIRVIEALNEDGCLQALDVPADGPSDPMPGTALLDPTGPLTWERLWSELGPGGTDALTQFDDGERRTADGQRDEEIDDPKDDERADQRHSRQQGHDDRFEHAQSARDMGNQGGQIAQHIGRGDALVVDRRDRPEHEIERARDEDIVEETERDLHRRDPGTGQAERPAPDLERPPHRCRQDPVGGGQCQARSPDRNGRRRIEPQQLCRQVGPGEQRQPGEGGLAQGDGHRRQEDDEPDPRRVEPHFGIEAIADGAAAQRREPDRMADRKAEEGRERHAPIGHLAAGIGDAQPVEAGQGGIAGDGRQAGPDDLGRAEPGQRRCDLGPGELPQHMGDDRQGDQGQQRGHPRAPSAPVDAHYPPPHCRIARIGR